VRQFLKPETVALMNSYEVYNVGQSAGVVNAMMTTAACHGLAFGMGVAVIRDPVLMGQPKACVGQFAWSGTSGCYFYVNKEQGLAGLFCTHARPIWSYNHRDQFANLACRLGNQLKLPRFCACLG
jgi:hypothetical protein